MESFKSWFSAAENQPWLAVATEWGIRVIIALLILLIGWWVARRVSRGVGGVMMRSGADPLLSNFLRNITYAVLLIVVVVGSLDRVGVPIASLLALMGAAGLAIGLALQGSLSHLAAGVLLMVFRPFRVGDLVEIAGVTGTVETVTLMHTRLRTTDNREVTLPNGKVAGDAIINYSALGTRRIDIVVGISYNDDIGKAIAAAMDVLKSDDRILEDPAPQVMVVGLGDSSVDLGIRPWANASDAWGVRTSVLRAIKERFDAEGISIPFPQSEIAVRSLPVPDAPKEKAVQAV
ncbi:MAG: mechanosensitive ion channel domain-containing protein [Dokdonella sp.]